MASYIKYLFKTVRKFYGEAVVVTQEVDDIISSPVVKETIINNSDCKILLDQRKYQNKFDQIQNLLGLTDKERSQILSINLANAANRRDSYSFPSFKEANPSLIALSVTDEIQSRLIGRRLPAFLRISLATSSPSRPASVAMITWEISFR